MLNQEQIQQIYQWWHVFKNNSELVEIRCVLDKLTYSGYYKNVENLIRDINAHDECGVYFTINPIMEQCYGRPQCEKMLRNPKNTTSDAEIIGRSWIYLDFDCEKVTNVNSTAEEKEYAHKKAIEVYNYLKHEGFNEPIIVDSANGYHAYYPCQLAVNDENDEMVEHFLKALSMLFSDEHVVIDTKTKNRSRISKVPGTFSRKGSALSEDRPQRMCRILKVPNDIIPTPKSYFEKIAALYQDEAPKPTKENHYTSEKFDVENFLNKHGVEYRKTRVPFGTRFILKECPFNPQHKDPDSMVFQYDTGAVSFMCYHQSCEQHDWKSFRMHFEPDAYDKKDYNEFKYKQRYYEKYRPVQEPAEIKAESAELGKKWLTLRDIKMEKDSERFSIKTGIYALDKAIGGLFEEQTTLLSGINASGKTAILNQLLLNAIQRDVPSALWSGELPAKRIKGWICQTAAGKNNVTKVEGLDKAYEVNEEVIGKIERWVDERLVIYNNNYGNNCEQIIADIIEAIEKYGLKFIVLDNLMALSLDYLVGTMNEKQKALMLKLDEIAKKYHVHILIIAHPRKEANFQLLRKESISGTSDLTNICWNLLLLHRVNDDFEKRATEFWGKERTQRLIYEGYNNIIEVAKNRDYGVENFLVGLYYEEETKRFKNSRAESMHYDWEEGIEEYHKLPDAPPAAMQPNTNFDNQGPVDPYEAQFQHDTLPPF